MGGDEAGGVGRRIDENGAGRRRDRARRAARDRAASASRRARAGRRPAARRRAASAPAKFGQAGEGISASSPGPTVMRAAMSSACMPPMVTKKRSGANSPPPGRRAIDARHVAGDRVAQIGDAALMGVERLAAIERGLGRVGDEGRRRQVAFADPQRDQALAAAAVVEDFDDAARRRVAHRRLDFGKPVGAGGGGRGIETFIAASWTAPPPPARGRDQTRRDRRSRRTRSARAVVSSRAAATSSARRESRSAARLPRSAAAARPARPAPASSSY